MKDLPPAGSYVAGGLAIGAATAFIYWQHYNDKVAAPPRLWLADGPLRDKVLPHCTHLLRPFAPTPWAANRHAQTILGFMRIHTIRSRYTRQLILTVDGATLGLDWFEGCDAPGFPRAPTAPVLLVCHGINGGSHEGYAKWVCAAALAHGWRATVLNYRGCNGLPFTSPRGYAATMSHDIFTAVYSVKARYPSAPLVAVGYSLGGLKLTKYVAEADAGLHVPPPGQPQLFTGSGLAAAAVVSSPVSLELSTAKLSNPASVNFLYNLAVAYKLRENIALHRRDIEALTRFDVDAALAAWTVGGIEEGGLPASLGFADRQQYYAVASSLDYIPAITTPTLILLAEDDPFLGIVPDVECSRNPATLLALTRRGGHVAFLQGAWPLGRSYMDDAVMEFFAATLEHIHGYGSGPPGTAEPRAAEPPTVTATTGDGGDAAAATATEALGGQRSDGAKSTAEAMRGTAWVTDAARAGAMAAATVAARRSYAMEGCPCGSEHHSMHAGPSAPAPATARERSAVPVRGMSQWMSKRSILEGRGGGAAGGGGAGSHQAEWQPGGSGSVRAAAMRSSEVGALPTRPPSDANLVYGNNTAQLRLMMQLQQHHEQRRLAGAVTAGGRSSSDRGSASPNVVTSTPVAGTAAARAKL